MRGAVLCLWSSMSAGLARAASSTAQCASEAAAAMGVRRVVAAGVSHPFGDERSVRQAFPSAIPAEEADPFLMCDNYAFPTPAGERVDADAFPVDWHPHRGMDILSYIKTGVGRHADSLGNRETFATPGLQWMACGSGVEHAEGGGGASGDVRRGFQIWINVPAARKMDAPRYGTVPPEQIPLLDRPGGARCRLLAGDLAVDGATRRGPFATTADVSVIDWELPGGATAAHAVAAAHDTCLFYAYKGGGVANGARVDAQDVVQLDAADAARRGVALAADAGGLSGLLFCGARLAEPIAWHGPIVMNTQSQIRETLRELQSGAFPPVRVPWDYRRAAARP